SIRSRVSQVGMVSFVPTRSFYGAVEAGVDALGEGVADALDLGDLLGPGGLEAGQAAEVAQQVAAPARADAGDILQPAHAACLLAPTAVAGDGEAVGLVAHLL